MQKKPSQSKNTTTYSNEDKLIKAYAEAFTNADAEKLLHTIYPMAVYNKIDQTRIKAIADDMVFINAIFKSTANSDPDYSMEIISRLNLDKDSIHDIEYYYSYNEGTQIAVKDGKYLTVRMEAFGERDTIYLTVFEIDGEGWKITPQSALYILGRG